MRVYSARKSRRAFRATWAVALPAALTMSAGAVTAQESGYQGLEEVIVTRAQARRKRAKYAGFYGGG